MERTRQTAIPSGFGAATTAREVLGERRLDGARRDRHRRLRRHRPRDHPRARRGRRDRRSSPARTLDKARAALAGDRARRARAARSRRPGVDRRVRRALRRVGPAAAHADQQRRHHGGAARARRARLRVAARDQPHRPLPAHGAAVAGAAAGANGARVVSLSSRGHARVGVDFEDPQFERRPYDKWVAYGQSKTANVLFAVGLDARGAGARRPRVRGAPGADHHRLDAVDGARGAAQPRSRPPTRRHASRTRSRARRRACGARPVRSSMAWAASTARTSTSRSPCRPTARAARRAAVGDRPRARRAAVARSEAWTGLTM